MNNPAILINPSAQPSRQSNAALFKIYVSYRSLLSVVLLIMVVNPNTRQLVGVLNPDLYIGVALLFLATNLPLVSPLSTRIYKEQRALLAVFLIDVLAITLLSHASAGMVSGLPILHVITVAASSVLIPNRGLAVLIAATSVVALLADTTRLIGLGVLDFSSLFPAGLLGSLILGVSVLVQAIARRLGTAEELAQERATDLYNLQRLNEQIVQHMQAGILLVSEDGIVKVMNKAATQFLAPDRPLAIERGKQLADYSADLAYQFEHWKNTQLHQATPIKVMDGAPQIIAIFRELQSSADRDALIFVQDYKPITQHAQSLKLTALGRMTASIAHEIRNPLGAISHAAQLLQESPDLVQGDQRMAEIILNHSSRVNHIVESVMQISRREPPKPEYLVLAKWLPKFVQAYLSTLNRDVDITVDCMYPELLIEFDPENLARILSNLLDNALRHSKLQVDAENARIEVGLDFTTNQCLIDVIDQGSGVAPVDQAKLFEPFFTTVEEGSGMGLYLCKELCEINHASLSYRLTDSGESCFRVQLKHRQH